MSLYGVYAKQLGLLRERAMVQFRAASRGEGGDYEALDKVSKKD